ncbi:MAG: nucleoside deaminase [Planctomycetota bacterium]|nr:MAG: nucleoside deaminase [Planctomycetota bacterium]
MDIQLKLPDWLSRINTEKAGTLYNRIEQRAEFVIELSRLNVEYNTGGPFAAAIFDIKTGNLISAGVNLVVPAHCSIAHAEMMAMMLAQQTRCTHTLSGCQLVSSCQLCAMCLGAIPWSGLKSVVCCARDEDARAIGFDEGDKPDNWIEKYTVRGIDIIVDISRSKACEVLKDYAKKSGHIY